MPSCWRYSVTANWEVRLFATVLEEELDRRATLRREIEHRLASDRPTVFVDVLDLASWIQDRTSEYRRVPLLVSWTLR